MQDINQQTDGLNEDKAIGDPPTREQYASELYDMLLSDGFSEQDLTPKADFVKRVQNRTDAATVYDKLIEAGYEVDNIGDKRTFMGRLTPKASVKIIIPEDDTKDTPEYKQAVANGVSEPFTQARFTQYKKDRKAADDEIKAAAESQTQVSSNLTSGGGMGYHVQSPEKKDVNKLKEKKNRDLKAKYGDDVQMFEDMKDLDDNLDVVYYSKTKKENRVTYNRLINATAWQNSLLNAVLKKAPEEVGYVQGVILRYQGKAGIGDETFATTQSENKHLKFLVYNYVDSTAERNKIFEAMSIDRSASSANEFLHNNWEEDISDKIQQVGAEIYKIKNEADAIHIQNYKEAAKGGLEQAGDTLTDLEQKKKGLEYKVRQIENVGASAVYAQIEEQLTDLKNKQDKGEFTETDQATRDTLIKRADELSAFMQKQAERYPLMAEEDKQRMIQEIVQGGESELSRLAEGIMYGLKDVVLNKAEQLMGFLTGNSDKVDLRLIGEDEERNTFHYRPESEQLYSEGGYTYGVLSPSVQDIRQSGKSRAQKTKMAEVLMGDVNWDKVQYLQHDPKLNLTGKTFVAALNDLAQQLIPQMIWAYAGGVGGATGYAGKFLSNFAASALQTFDKVYANKLKDGDRNAAIGALMETAIIASAEGLVPDYHVMKNMFTGKLATTPIGRVLGKVTEQEFNRVVTEAVNSPLKTFIRGFKKSIGENAGGAIGEAASEKGGEMGLAAYKKYVEGQDVGILRAGDADFVMTAIPMLGLAVAGALFKGSKIGAGNRFSLWEMGADPNGYKLRVDGLVRSGKMAASDAARWNEAIDKYKVAVDAVPEFNAKGEPLTDEEKANNSDK